MATQSISLFHFFSDSSKEELIIPIYQRPYSWNRDQVEDLFKDIKYIVNSGSVKHFMGLLVLTRNESPIESFDIIDGQQRITTLCIILAIIRDKLDDIYDNHGNQLPKNLKEKLQGTVARIDSCLHVSDTEEDKRLKLKTLNEREYEQEILSNILIRIGSLSPTDSRLMAHNDQPVGEKNTFGIKVKWMNGDLGRRFDRRKVKARRAYKNYIDLEMLISTENEFQSHFSTLEGKIKFYCDRLVRAILDQITVVDFVTRDYSEAFNIFEVLNDRGLAISSTDLIKNLCLKQVGITKRPILHNLWKQIFDQELSNSDDIQFLRYSNNSRRSFITKNEIYGAYSVLIRSFSETDLISFLENDLLQDALNFKLLRNEALTHENITLNNAIKLLQSTKSTQWYSVGLSVLRAHNFDRSIVTSDKLKIVLERIHEIIFNLVLTEKKANKVEKFFPEVSVRLMHYTTISEMHSKIDEVISLLDSFIRDENMSFASIVLDQVDFQSSNSLASMFLFYFDYRAIPNYKLCIKSLEHILPQNPKESNWQIISGMSKDELDKYIYSIGNMLLIESPLNSRIKAENYTNKKIEYCNFNVTDPLGDHSTFGYKQLNTFDLSTIDQRKLEIYKKFQHLIS